MRHNDRDLPISPPLDEDVRKHLTPLATAPGIGRIMFLTLLCGVISILNHDSPKLGSFEGITAKTFYFSAAAAALCYFRLKNMGANPWLSLIAAVPFAGVLIILPCIFCQSHFMQTQKVDKGPRIVLSLILLLIVAAVLMALVGTTT